MLYIFYCQTPKTEQEWEAIEEQFNSRWQLPHCIGALDGKHIRIAKPHHSGSQYINYKGFFSIVLMAVVNADYQFLYVDVGAEGRMSDGGVFAHCSLSEALATGCLHIPAPKKLLPQHHSSVPYYLICDDAFPLKEYMMKPFSKRSLTEAERICNYRFSRARRVVENAFGILAAVFRVLHTPILLQPEKAEKVVLAVCVLHNFLRERCRSEYQAALRRSEDLRTDVDGLVPLQASKNNNSTNSAKEVRILLQNYFVTEGRVAWQDVYKDAF